MLHAYWVRKGQVGSARGRLLPPLQVVASLMHEIECILHEYLSFNWDRVEDIYDANAVYLAPDGLACSWKSHSTMQVPTFSNPALSAAQYCNACSRCTHIREKLDASAGFSCKARECSRLH